MIYTVTFNPAIDYNIRIDDLAIGELNRISDYSLTIGGKGINVSKVLHGLNLDNICLGFISGFSGEHIESELSDFGVKTDFVHLKSGITRINIKLKGNNETEINADGPKVDKDSLEELYKKINKLKDGDYLVLAGSIPNNLSQSIYTDIIKSLKDKKINFVVDATKELLLNVLQYRPFLVKPNAFELGQMFDVEIHNNDDVRKYSRKLQDLGAKNVLVSLGKDGAILLDEKNNFHEMVAPSGILVNSVGAGDSMVAGFIYGCQTFDDYEKAFKFSVCAGSATAFKDGVANLAEVQELLQKVEG